MFIIFTVYFTFLTPIFFGRRLIFTKLNRRIVLKWHTYTLWARECCFRKHNHARHWCCDLVTKFEPLNVNHVLLIIRGLVRNELERMRKPILSIQSEVCCLEIFCKVLVTLLAVLINNSNSLACALVVPRAPHKCICGCFQIATIRLELALVNDLSRRWFIPLLIYLAAELSGGWIILLLIYLVVDLSRWWFISLLI